ncbi:MAG: hypothetical protein ACLGRW_10130 [Acidobacteriota bacterium]
MALFYLAEIAEVGVCGLLLYRRVWSTLPVFFIYSLWTLLSGAGNFLIFRYLPVAYSTAYLVQLIVDSILMFGVLVEVGWSILRPARSSLPRGALVMVAGLILAVGMAIWPFAAIQTLVYSSHKIHVVVQLQQTVSILEIIFFLVLIACSQLLSIGWRDRELQVATGLGFYSFVSMAAAMLHMHETAVSQYRHLNRIVVASYLCSLVYWIVSFSQKKAERREFTPEMQNFLLAVAGMAHSTRVALTESENAKKQPWKDR